MNRRPAEVALDLAQLGKELRWSSIESDLDDSVQKARGAGLTIDRLRS
jgi:hypothetical protein